MNRSYEKNMTYVPFLGAFTYSTYKTKKYCFK